jgi:hypothetical protein
MSEINKSNYIRKIKNNKKVNLLNKGNLIIYFIILFIHFFRFARKI